MIGSKQWTLKLAILVGISVIFPVPLNAQVTQSELRKVVQKAIDDNPEMVEKPKFEIDELALYYRFGRFNRHSQNPQNLFEIPTDTQFVVELIRKYPWRRINQSLWQPYLEEVEQIITKELRLIQNNNRKKTDLMEQLSDYEDKSTEVLMRAVARMAARDRRELAPVGARRTAEGKWEIPAQYSLKSYRAILRSIPSNAKVYYLTVVDYEVAALAGRLGQDEIWNSITGKYEYLGGKFYFRAKWPNGKSAKPARIRIHYDDQEITLRPDT
jgi:hypothetical protein